MPVLHSYYDSSAELIFLFWCALVTMQVVMVPYVPHALLTMIWGRQQSQGNGQQQLTSTAGHQITR